MLCLLNFNTLYVYVTQLKITAALLWRHNGCNCVSNLQPRDRLLNCSFRRRGADQRKHQSSASLVFVRGSHRWHMNSPHKWPVTRKMFPFDDVIMSESYLTCVPTIFLLAWPKCTINYTLNVYIIWTLFPTFLWYTPDGNNMPSTQPCKHILSLFHHRSHIAQIAINVILVRKLRRGPLVTKHTNVVIFGWGTKVRSVKCTYTCCRRNIVYITIHTMADIDTGLNQK